MSHLLERLRAAIGAQYEVIGELASGGMGFVFRGFDPTLRRPVAIKVLRPELATASQAARFSREARILAKLSHPNIVTVHQAGEADGLYYYVMEFAEGETLEDRLSRGPLESGEAVRTARDLLAGLAAAHQAGVIHRDLKPANILLRPERAMLGDFGISLVETTTSDDDVTDTNPGTRAYMAPEQRYGSPATVRSDLYSLAMVLYQAATGDRWTTGGAVDQGRWNRVPTRLRRSLRRALEPAPDRRWPSAAAMAKAIDRPATPWIVAAIAVVAAVVAFVLVTPPEASPGTLRIHLDTGPSGRDPIADSAGAVVRDRLAGAMDFSLLPSKEGATATVRTRLTVESDSLRFSANVDRGGLRSSLVVATDPVPRSRWRAAADSLADRLIRGLYLADFDPWLPRDALPRSAIGLGAWHLAERAFRFAQWDRAFELYREALDRDSTCYLCLYRLGDVERWLSRPVAAQNLEELLRYQDRFPAHYQALIRARSLRARARLDSLEAAATAFPDFALGWFALGDEEFHRAALHGRPRTDARTPLEKAVGSLRDFAPGWEHLAWLGLALGDTILARISLDSLAAAPAGGRLPEALHQLLRMAGRWLLASPEGARAATDSVVADPEIWQLRETSAGARVLLTMGSPQGAIYLGLRFAEQAAHREIVQNGLLGAFFGATGAGQSKLAEQLESRLRRFDANPELELFLAEWNAVLGLIRPDSTRPDPVPALRDLARESTSALARDRLRWLLAVVDSTGSVEIPAGDLGTVVTAIRAARAGQPDRALALTDSLHPLEPGPPVDPFLPLVLRWLRADWLERVGRPTAAAWELGGYRHLQLIGLPNGRPQAGEVDWSFGPDQAWRRARLFGEQAAAAERCGALAEVARWWKDGDPTHRGIADSATVLHAAMSCGR